jgi:hypothetical protein
MDYRRANFGAYSDRQHFTDKLGPAYDRGEATRTHVTSSQLAGVAQNNVASSQPRSDEDCATTSVVPGTSEASPSSQGEAFLPGKYSCPEDVWKSGLNPNYWRWGLVFNQGNGMNVTEERIRERLRIIAARLLKKIYGNHYRDRGRVRFMAFQHGSEERYDQHFHVLMAIEGERHGWPDWRIALQVQSIDRLSRSGAWNEKPVHVDFRWRNGNRYHSYDSRFLQSRNGAEVNWFVL